MRFVLPLLSPATSMILLYFQEKHSILLILYSQVWFSFALNLSFFRATSTVFHLQEKTSEEVPCAAGLLPISEISSAKIFGRSFLRMLHPFFSFSATSLSSIGVISSLQAGIGHFSDFLQHSWQKRWPILQKPWRFLSILFFCKKSSKQKLHEKSPWFRLAPFSVNIKFQIPN